MRKIFYIILILSLSATPCFAGVNVKKEVKRGNLLYNKGKFVKSLKQYERALSGAPDSDIVNFDLGTALYKLKDYEIAMEHFRRALVTDDSSLEQKASYNLGNAEYKSGISREDSNLPQAAGLLNEALRHYERAIELDFDDEDAKYNYEFVKKELRRLEEKLKQQGPEEQKRKESEEEKEYTPPTQQQQARRQQAQQLDEEEQARRQQAQQLDEEEDKRQREALQEAEEEKDKGAQEQTRPQQAMGKMLEKEAEMLLDSYSHEEEPRGLYKEKIQMRGLPEVLKDW